MEDRHSRRENAAEEHDDDPHSPLREQQDTDQPDDEDGHRADVVRAGWRDPPVNVVDEMNRQEQERQEGCDRELGAVFHMGIPYEGVPGLFRGRILSYFMT
jgi:hypothetical protein